ncbi:SMP-30/gluconolactonase/LRE family protein [Rhizobacter sp. LjRoot28]|uniref:SMP-30/gluconolactonase/LRE family protein n=1 Tax=Rhizobacter sp. LjRoot28 TaxID=3342309 RepID=UPI003ED16AAF
MSQGAASDWQLAVPPTAVLGESPAWHAGEQCLYYCDIAAHQLRRFDPATGELRQWQFGTHVASVAPMADGALLLAQRNGLWRFEPSAGRHELLVPPPYDLGAFRFNDGKCDPQGRFWVGTLSDAREPVAALYRFDAQHELTEMVGGLTVANGLAFSPDGRTLYHSDTTAHAIYAADFEPTRGTLSNRRVFAQFPKKDAGQGLSRYGGRPDGAAVDLEGCYWVAMFEGARVLKLSPTGEVLRELPLPVQCPTMPCFGGPDLRTLYLTTSREKRPDAELASQPWAGGVLSLRVDVPGLPTSVFG